MGADTFTTFATGKTAKEAFNSAVSDAQYEYGHGGYTGSIAEKNSFVMIGEAATTRDAMDLADKLVDEGDSRIDDKWGPAGCIKITNKPDTWLFFGWASS